MARKSNGMVDDATETFHDKDEQEGIELPLTMSDAALDDEDGSADAENYTRFRVQLHNSSLKELKDMVKASGIERDVLVDMALQALQRIDEDDAVMFYQIATNRKAVRFAGLKLGR